MANRVTNTKGSYFYNVPVRRCINREWEYTSKHDYLMQVIGTAMRQNKSVDYKEYMQGSVVYATVLIGANGSG